MTKKIALDIWDRGWHLQVCVRAVTKVQPSSSPAGHMKNLQEHRHQRRAFSMMQWVKTSHFIFLWNLWLKRSHGGLHKQILNIPLPEWFECCFFTRHHFGLHLFCSPYRQDLFRYTVIEIPSHRIVLFPESSQCKAKPCFLGPSPNPNPPGPF